MIASICVGARSNPILCSLEISYQGRLRTSPRLFKWKRELLIPANAFGYKSRDFFGYGRNAPYHSSKRTHFLKARSLAQAGGTSKKKSYRKNAKNKQPQAQWGLRSTSPLIRYVHNMLEIKLQADCSNFSRLGKLLQAIIFFQAVDGYKIELIILDHAKPIYHGKLVLM